jgi:CheY-like chemotaxis protein/HPt (histidine-containing phosphotransfer) domain-containing protein
VLVVDDNATNRRILEEMLANWRMRPTVVDGGPAALAALERARAAGAPFALVLLDAMMPEVDGFMLAAQIREQPGGAGTTLMMLSSAGRREDATRCQELGIRHYLTKPIKQSDLLDGIRIALHPEAQEDRPAPAEEAAAKRGRSLHILLAEDVAVNQKLAMRMLERRGHTVVLANNGKEALAALEQERFDLVLMDVQRPEMDGFEATRAIREREDSCRFEGSRFEGSKVEDSPEPLNLQLSNLQTGGDAQRRLPILAMTAHAMKGDRERCLEAGMDGYVSKPIQAQELFEAIEEAVGTVGSRQKAVGSQDSASELPTAYCLLPSGPTAAELDREAVLARVEGNRELLRELVGLFLKDCPGHLVRIREAIACEDGPGLRRAAHALKGSVSNFAAGRASEAALRLERMADQAGMAGADEAYAELEVAVEQLKTELRALVGGKEGSEALKAEG